MKVIKDKKDKTDIEILHREKLWEEFERKKRFLGTSDKEWNRFFALIRKETGDELFGRCRRGRNMNRKSIPSLPARFLKSRSCKYLFYGLMLAGIGVCFSEIAFAEAKFDISAGIEGGTKPLIDAIKEHWGKGVLLSGGASAFIGEGDARQRAIRAIVGCLASGGVVMALIAMLTD